MNSAWQGVRFNGRRRAGTSGDELYELQAAGLKMQQPTLTGIHHLTAISSSIRRNHQFYTQVMGLRLVKRSVNQDDVSAYHLFYADGAGSPGTDITFFDWDVPPERRGTHSLWKPECASTVSRRSNMHPVSMN